MTRTNTDTGASELEKRLRRAKYEPRGEAVLLCMLAAEEIGRLRYDLTAVKAQCARLAAAQARRPPDVGASAVPGGWARAAEHWREVRPS